MKIYRANTLLCFSPLCASPPPPHRCFIGLFFIGPPTSCSNLSRLTFSVRTIPPSSPPSLPPPVSRTVFDRSLSSPTRGTNGINFFTRPIFADSRCTNDRVSPLYSIDVRHIYTGEKRRLYYFVASSPFNRPRGPKKKINRVVIPWLTMTRAFPYPLRNSFALRVESRFVRATHSSGDDPPYLITLERTRNERRKERRRGTLSRFPFHFSSPIPSRIAEESRCHPRMGPPTFHAVNFPTNEYSPFREIPTGQAAFKLLASARGAGSVKSA